METDWELNIVWWGSTPSTKQRHANSLSYSALTNGDWEYGSTSVSTCRIASGVTARAPVKHFNTVYSQSMTCSKHSAVGNDTHCHRHTKELSRALTTCLKQLVTPTWLSFLTWHARVVAHYIHFGRHVRSVYDRVKVHNRRSDSRTQYYQITSRQPVTCRLAAAHKG